MLSQDVRHIERISTEDTDNIDAKIQEPNGANCNAEEKGADERATYEDPSELDMETRLVAHTSCERWNVVVAVPERLRLAPPVPSTRTTRRNGQRRTTTKSGCSAADHSVIFTHLLQECTYIFHTFINTVTNSDTFMLIVSMQSRKLLYSPTSYFLGNLCLCFFLISIQYQNFVFDFY